ncbi:hypothetical protein ACFOKF_04605 [Sphingobium rhizovicinum]|uniref:TonB C-terminal domain-containing protein n=1 Tax=Sphingobium rhizovicinum TaxID=432308 RepID=A0ABV7NCN2_9SPHN
MAAAIMPVMAQGQDSPSPVLTVQQAFDAAATAAQSGDYVRAVDILSGLEQRVKAPRSLAIVRLRKGVALTELSRWAEAQPLLEQAIAALPSTDRTLDMDRCQALLALGRMALNSLDYDAAQARYADALTVANDASAKIAALSGEAQAAIFIDPAVGLAKTEEAERLMAGAPEIDKATAGYVAAMRGRALLNLGRFGEAESAFAKAVKAEGGLTMKVGYADLVARSDAAIAAMLAGHRDTARNYLVYTGAGRMEKQDFTYGADMALPQCGEDGVQPDDVAVVEFGIGDDGAVSYARPVYGSRQGGMALVFARAVTRWTWKPEDVAQIPLLFRMVTRLELRCSTGEGGPSLYAGLKSSFRQWLDQHGAPAFDPAGEQEAQRKLSLENELTRLQSGSSAPLAQADVLARLLENPLTAGKVAQDHAVALRTILMAQGAPPMVLLYADILKIRDSENGRLTDSDYGADPRAAAMMRLLGYDRMRPREKQRSRDILDRIIADPALTADDPVRVAALTRRASARVAARDMAGARADFLATGLTAQQCSVVDAQPVMRGNPASSGDYPMDMVRVGVEGWSMVQFDVSADGKTLNQRAIISYPPMVFSNNSVRIYSRAAFEQSYRPAGALGCGGSVGGITFRMPN